jgi:ubiquinone biosynthesis protein COQ4
LFAEQTHEFVRTLADRGATFADSCAALATPARLAACDEQLRADPDFARRSRERCDPLAGLAHAGDLPAGSLGRCHADYMAHYRLMPDFFPLPEPQGAELTPLRYAVQLLNRCHDLLHVLGAYETHDADEAAVQSFVLGNAPVVHAAFLAALVGHPSLALPGFKHLRDIFDHPIVPADVRRGRAAAPLLTVPFEDLLARPLTELRRDLGVAPRTVFPTRTDNSCGGSTETPFFDRAPIGSRC